MATTPTKQSNEQYEEVDDMKKVEATTGVVDVTPDTILDPQQRALAERALVWKLDMRLMPMIALIFIMNYIGTSPSYVRRCLSLTVDVYVDRTAVTSARLKGMETDLGITGEFVMGVVQA